MFQSSCVNCGCTDSRACMTDSGPCYWLREDEDAFEGVCSNCPEALEAWDEGHDLNASLPGDQDAS